MRLFKCISLFLILEVAFNLNLGRRVSHVEGRSVEVWTTFTSLGLLSEGSPAAEVQLTSADPAHRTLFIQIVNDAWVSNTPLQFRSSALSLSGMTDRKNAPYGAAALAEDPLFLQQTIVEFTNSTLARITLPHVPLFDGDGETGAETVTLSIDAILLASGGISVGSSVRRGISFRVLLGTEEDSRDGYTEWTIWIFLLVFVTAIFDPFATCDLQMLVLIGLSHCSRGPVARVTAGCFRTVALLTWDEDDTEPVLVFLSSLFVPLLLIPACYIVAKFVVKKSQPYWFYYGVLNFFFTALAWSTFRQLAQAEGRVENYIFGIIGLPLLAGLLAIEGAWKFKAASKVRLRPFSWSQQEWTVRLGILPGGYWEPRHLYWESKTMLTTLHPFGQPMLVYNHAVALIGAATIGVAPQGPSTCGAMFTVLAIWYFCNTVFIIAHRIYLTNVLAGSAALCYLFVGLAASGAAIQASNSSISGPHLFQAGAGGLTATIVLRLGYKAYLWWMEDRWRVQALTSKSSS